MREAVAPVRSTITAAHPPTENEFVLDLVRWATEYAMHASPEHLDRQMRRAYGDLVPGSSARQRAVEDDLTGRLRDTEPVRRRLAEEAAVSSPAKPRRSRRRATRPTRGLVKATCAYERCSKPFEYEWPAHNKRYCSERCRWRAAARRARLRPVDPSRVLPPEAADEVLSEMQAALDNLRALVGEGSDDEPLDQA